MKRIIISIVLFILIIIFCIFSRYLVDYSINEIIPHLDQALITINENDIKKSSENINNANDLWHKYSKILSLYLRHNEIDIIDASFIRATSHIKTENSGLYIMEINEIKEALLHLIAMDKLTLGNIF